MGKREGRDRVVNDMERNNKQVVEPECMFG